ncbi:MAG: TrkH family potassium uptake protein, partial [Clostridia bacterium]|nr:TrkH family potassium uptake protein [Clostridia bacterium]
MNRKMVLHIFGRIALLEGALMLIPAVVSLIYGEMRPVLSFLVASGGAMLIGAAINYFVHPKDHVIYAREGFVTVTVAWIGMALIGAMPFVISGEIPNFIDAVFETMSGFTTTGATILTDIESLSRGILFWRSFTHWLGGMGVLVFIMAIANNFTDRSIHIMRAEMPGPVVGKLLPKVKDTAKILYLIYMGLTLLETVFLCFGGLSLYEALIHSFGTAGTGGFSIYSA